MSNDFELVQDGAHAREMMVVVAEFKERRRDRLLDRAFGKIEDNKLGPHEALWVLMELKSLADLERSLTAASKRGESAAARINGTG